MLTSFPISILVGSCLGFLTGLGTGGGSLLILWLTVVAGMEPTEARVYNLLFFLPAALLSILLQVRKERISLKKLFPGILAGCIAAGSVSFLTQGADTALLRKAFGIVLLVTGIRELFYRERKAK